MRVVADERFADQLLDEVADHLDELAATSAVELPARLQPIVRRTLLARRPDGSWPEPALLAEALAAYVGLLEQRMADDGIRDDDLTPEERRWLDALRACVQSPQLFDDMLADLRADVPPPGPTPP